MTFSLFLNKFWKSRNFGDFGHFSTNFACRTHFQEVTECKLEVFHANVAIWPDKTCILTGSTQNPAPKRICTLQAHPGPFGAKNARFSATFFKRCAWCVQALENAPSAPSAPFGVISTQRTNPDLRTTPQSKIMKILRKQILHPRRNKTGGFL